MDNLKDLISRYNVREITSRKILPLLHSESKKPSVYGICGINGKAGIIIIDSLDFDYAQLTSSIDSHFIFIIDGKLDNETEDDLNIFATDIGGCIFHKYSSEQDQTLIELRLSKSCVFDNVDETLNHVLVRIKAFAENAEQVFIQTKLVKQ